MAHTPGEWVKQPNGAAYNIRRLDQPHHMIVLNMNYIPTDEFEANVNLIATAPEMLEALKAVIDITQGESQLENDELRVYRMVQAAIAKAEGQNV